MPPAELARARKRFGQHFLHDPAQIARIVAAVRPQPGQRLVEIGPGRGAITEPLLRAAGMLDVVEIDRDLVPLLRAQFGGLGELRVHEADALRFDFTALAPAPHGLRVVGNLPYNISTPLLFRLLAQAERIDDLHLMLQREVVARLAAAPGGGDYGRLSVMVQYRCAIEPLFILKPGAFNPPPRVDSAFVRLEPYRSLPYPARSEPALAAVVAKAFGQRRKTLRNALRGLLDGERIAAAGIDPGTRPEQLAVADWVRLADLYAP